MASSRYSAMDYLEGHPLPDVLVHSALHFTVAEFEDIGVVELSTEEEDQESAVSRDAASEERLELGLPLSFGTSKRQDVPKKKRKRDPPRPSRSKEAGALRKALGRRFIRYWLQRYSLFSKFDEGIQLDQEGWYSVTPECLARHHAQRCSTASTPVLVLDACCGVGGNAIQFATHGHHVCAVDLDASRLHMAQHNAQIYHAQHRIDFLLGDVFEVGHYFKADVIFLSPPWGGPSYQHHDYTSLESGSDLGQFVTRALELIHSWKPHSTRVMLFLPRNVDLCQLMSVDGLLRGSDVEVEIMIINDIVKAVTVYLNV